MTLHLGIPLLYVLFRLIDLTLRKRYEGEHKTFCSMPKEGRRVIVAFWHGDSFYMAHEIPKITKYHRHHIMASKSRDGALMARYLRLAGATVVRGSSSRGGGKALLEMIRAMGDSHSGAIAVDAPRGPRHRVNKKGILLLAKRTGAPVFPAAARAEKKWAVRSWDRTEIPKPFSAVTLELAPPIQVPPDADDDRLEALREHLEKPSGN